MDRCPKCLSNKIGGPAYRKSAFGYECLTYRCERCGYTQDEQTADAKERGGYVPYGLRR